ncbi:MAG: UbiD family decarboxylase [Nitrososphaerota archaeon]|nr:UbiD family decarboxylase [Nitrososphaerota archaeon]
MLSALREAGELARVAAPVDPRLEVAEIVDRTSKAGGPALLFEHVRGSDLPLAVNLFGSQRRVALALGVAHVDVRIYDPREDDEPGGVYHPVSRGCAGVRADPGDPPVADGHSAAAKGRRRGDSPVLYHQVGWAQNFLCCEGRASVFIAIPLRRGSFEQGGMSGAESRAVDA